jgi:hypothetical protein
MPDYYQKAVIPFVLRESDNLFFSYEAGGLVKKAPIPVTAVAESTD